MPAFRALGREYLQAIGQSFFLRDARFGALLLAAIAAMQPLAFLYGAIASLLCFAHTVLRHTPRLLRDTGLTTLNGLFFGVALASLYEPGPATWLCLFFGALLVPLLTRACFEVLQHWKLSPFILPYILSVWLVSLCASDAALAPRPEGWIEKLRWLEPLRADGSLIESVAKACLLSIGRLFFIPDERLGMAILGLVLLLAPRAGLFFAAGTLIGTLSAWALSGGGAAWQYGFLSYGAGLVGLGLASFPERIPAWRILFLCAMTALFSIATRNLLLELPLPALSLPYLLAIWLALLSRAPRMSLEWGSSAGRVALSALGAVPVPARRAGEGAEAPGKAA